VATWRGLLRSSVEDGRQLLREVLAAATFHAGRRALSIRGRCGHGPA